MSPGLVFGICGYSGSGKTTVILELIRELSTRGLRVGVVKHDTHGLTFDSEGKDSDRFFKAGADVLMRGPDQLFLRVHDRNALTLEDTLKRMGPYFDIILVEGHKTTPLENKIWLCGDTDETPPPEAVNLRCVLKRTDDRVRIVLQMIDDWLPAAWGAVPLYAGILIGGRSTRMGRPKHLLEAGTQTWVERLVATVKGCVDRVVLLGSGDIPESLRALPKLCDVEDAQGPLRGQLAALRWAPFASWVFVSCDLPLFSEAALRWLLGHRRPGVWAALPRHAGSGVIEPLFAYYDFRARPLLEACQAPVQITSFPQVETPEIPPHLDSAWTNVNTVEDLALLSI